jgi:hypothetical protein
VQLAGTELADGGLLDGQTARAVAHTDALGQRRVRLDRHDARAEVQAQLGVAAVVGADVDHEAVARDELREERAGAAACSK